MPSNTGTSTAYTYAIQDLGTGFATTGALSATITGLEGGQRYRVALTPYTVGTDGGYLYRASSGVSQTPITTIGSTVPGQPPGTPAAPNVLGVDSLSWTGAALGAQYNGGSVLTGYLINLYREGSSTPVQSVTVAADGDVPPSYVFTGLDRDTLYHVRYAAINANGTGPLSNNSPTVRTLLKPIPGTVAPRYADRAELLAAIALGDVTEITAESIGILKALESNAPLTFAADWLGADTEGELWLYPMVGDAVFQDVFQVTGGQAQVDSILGDLDTDSYYLALYAETDTPIAVELAVTKPVTGPTELEDAVFRWGFNNESNNGAFFGGCNFFAAGKSPSAGSATPFQQWQYQAQGTGVDENVRVEKPNAAGEYTLATWANKCHTRTGVPVTTSVTTAFTESQVVITGGAGIVDPSTNSAELQWTGSFTVAYYGGMTFWYVTDPKLSIVNGVGTLTATASGYGADMFDTSKWIELAPRPITLATLSNVKLTSQGITVTPDFLGVVVNVDGGSHQPQSPKTPDNAAYWGSFPADFIDFQAETGQIAYWYSSGGAQDRAKPTLPLYIGYDAATFDDPDAGSGGGTGEELGGPDALERPQAPLRISFASGTETSVDSLDALKKLIDDGTVGTLPASSAGIPATFAIGERLDFDFEWDGDDTKGVLWLYPEVEYAGTFTVVDGRVIISLDSSVFETEGEKFFTFFGDEGTVIAIAAEAVGFIAPVGASPGGSAGAPTTAIPISALAAPGSLSTPLMMLIVGGLGTIVVSAGAGGVVLLRRRVV